MTFKADLPTTAAALAALLVSADGVLDERELTVAVSLGQGMFLDFSPRLFQDLLEGLHQLPSPEELAQFVRPLLDADGKVLIMEYLVALAVADERVVDVERQQLESLAHSLDTPLPSFGPYGHEIEAEFGRESGSAFQTPQETIVDSGE